MNELEIIQHRQIKGLTVFLNTVDYRTPHVHPEWELIWVLDQPLSVACGQRQFVVEEGQLVLFSPNELHEFHKLDNSCTFLCLQISEDILPPLPQRVMEEYLLHHALPQEALGRVKDSLGQIALAYLQQQKNFGLLCVGSSCLMLHLILSHMPSHEISAEEAASLQRKNARLKRLIRFVDQHYMEKIRLADFAEAEGCSVSYLSRFIKSTMNQTFQAYVTSVRFNCACKLIAAGGKGMLEVCMESGFSDYRYFAREFRKQYGMTPEAYSRQTRNRPAQEAVVRHSLHSVERFYSREESLKLLRQYLAVGC